MKHGGKKLTYIIKVEHYKTQPTAHIEHVSLYMRRNKPFKANNSIEQLLLKKIMQRKINFSSQDSQVQ